MTTEFKLQDLNSGALTTIDFDQDPNNIIRTIARTDKGERLYNYSTQTTVQSRDYGSTNFKYVINFDTKSNAIYDLLTKYKIKVNRLGYRLTIPGHRGLGVGYDPLRYNYLDGILGPVTSVDMGGEEKPHYVITMEFIVVNNL